MIAYYEREHMIGADTFDILYRQLAHDWETHQALRRGHAPLTTLAESSARLYQARMEMWDWRSDHTTRTG